MSQSRFQTIRSPEAPEPPPGHWSNCKKYGDHVYIAGITALKGDEMIGIADPYKQTCQIFDSIKGLMEAAGGTMNDIIKMIVFVSDMRHRPAVLEARRQYFTGDFPCSTLVQVTAFVDPRMLVEIEAVGFVS
jgi:2-iminobutanoate/2-iminopropanoate deaminase